MRKSVPRPSAVALGIVLGALLACAPNTEPRSQAPMPPPVVPPRPPERPEAAVLSPLFESERTLRLEFEAPIESVWRQRRAERRFLPARLVYENESGRAIAVRTEVRLRGKSRATSGDCRFPLFDLHFSPEESAETVFANLSLLRMTNHCRASAAAEQHVLLEFLAYRSFVVLTDLSYRVRLAHIRYTDSDGNGDPLTRYAFFTEPEGEMAARNGWETLSLGGVSRSELELNQLSLVEVFQYMVGNTDWSAMAAPSDEDCCHNVQLIGGPGFPVIPVPYDFDSAGLVDPPYADPNPALGIRSVRTRVYRGICKHPEYMDRTLETFRAKKPALYALYREQEGLDERQRNKAIQYLDAFYETIDDRDQVRRELSERCR